MNVITVDGYHAKIEYDEELDLFRGEILGLNGGQIFTTKIRRNSVLSSRSHCASSSRSARKRGLSPSVISRVNSTFESLLSCMRGSRSKRKLKARASVPWRKRRCKRG